MDEIELNKLAILQRCFMRIQEEYELSCDLRHYSHIDALTLNVERACQACIDWAMHRISTGKLGVPQSNAEAFEILKDHGLIDEDLCRSLRAMCGFRNIAVHEYQSIDLGVLRVIAEEKALDFKVFAQRMGASPF
jgi:uncharacterized protein YutE (UPF0331/DUF86 family)